MTRVLGTFLIIAAIVIGLINNDTYKWAIGIPVVLAVAGVGLRIEAALTADLANTRSRRDEGVHELHLQ